jgi:hypothetical protein
MKLKKSRKKGSGRPKGSKSFTDVSLHDISKLLGEDNSQELIPISRVWLEKKGFKRAIDLCRGVIKQ